MDAQQISEFQQKIVAIKVQQDLIEAIESDNYNVVRDLLNRDDVTAEHINMFHQEMDEGMTLLLYAVFAGHVNAVRALCNDPRTEILKPDALGKNVLHLLDDFAYEGDHELACLDKEITDIVQERLRNDMLLESTTKAEEQNKKQDKNQKEVQDKKQREQIVRRMSTLSTDTQFGSEASSNVEDSIDFLMLPMMQLLGEVTLETISRVSVCLE